MFIDIGKNVTQYIPNTVSKMFSDPQNSYIGMYDQGSNKAYFYRTYVENQQILMRSWYSWELPGNIQFLMSDSDTVFAVTKQTNKVALLKTQLNSIPTGAAVTAGVQVPSFDFRAFVGNSGITHDTTSDTSRIPIPFPKNTALSIKKNLLALHFSRPPHRLQLVVMTSLSSLEMLLIRIGM